MTNKINELFQLKGDKKTLSTIANHGLDPNLKISFFFCYKRH